MKLAIDVFYRTNNAKIVGVLFENWQDKLPKEWLTTYSNDIEEYVPGQFYKRELPCILHLINDLDLRNIELIIVDGHVYLDNEAQVKGLGAHLYDALDGQIPIIGVAKSEFQGNQQQVCEVLRGSSKNPLYVSAIGLDKTIAAQHIAQMYGDNRMPNILSLLDVATKKDF